MDIFPPAKQRAALLEFAKALGSADSSLHCDECGDWVISGQEGHIYAVLGGTFLAPEPLKPSFQFLVFSGAKQAWTHAKKALAFARLCNDGDDEGGFILDRYPTNSEADAIRAYCRIHKRPALSAERLADLRERGRVLQKNRRAA